MTSLLDRQAQLKHTSLKLKPGAAAPLRRTTWQQCQALCVKHCSASHCHPCSLVKPCSATRPHPCSSTLAPAMPPAVLSFPSFRCTSPLPLACAAVSVGSEPLLSFPCCLSPSSAALRPCHSPALLCLWPASPCCSSRGRLRRPCPTARSPAPSSRRRTTHRQPAAAGEGYDGSGRIRTMNHTMKVLTHMSRKEQARWPRDGTASGKAVAVALLSALHQQCIMSEVTD